MAHIRQERLFQLGLFRQQTRFFQFLFMVFNILYVQQQSGGFISSIRQCNGLVAEFPPLIPFSVKIATRLHRHFTNHGYFPPVFTHLIPMLRMNEINQFLECEHLRSHSLWFPEVTLKNEIIILQLPCIRIAPLNSKRQRLFLIFQRIESFLFSPLLPPVKEKQQDKQRKQQNHNRKDNSSPQQRMVLAERDMDNGVLSGNIRFRKPPLHHHVPIYHIFFSAICNGHIQRLLTMQNPDSSIHHLPHLYGKSSDIAAQQFFAIAKSFIDSCQAGTRTDISNIDSREIPFQLKITPISCILA